MSANLHEALRAACGQVGIVYRDVPTDGNFHRTDAGDGANGKGDGTIKLFPDGEGVRKGHFPAARRDAGRFQQPGREKPRHKVGRQLTPPDTGFTGPVSVA